MVRWLSLGWLELLLEAPSTAAKCSVGKVRAGWVEAEELVEGDLDLVFSESGLLTTENAE